MADLYTITEELAARPPFEFGKTLTYLEAFGPSRGDFTQGATTHTRALTIEGQTVVVAIRARDGEPGIAYTLYADAPITDALRESVEARLRRFLSLDDDLEPLYALAQDDPQFEPIARLLYGYHQVLFPSAFECCVWGVLSQRNLFSIALNMKHALIREYGGILTVDGETYRAFPDPARLAIASGEEVGRVIGHRPKGALLPGVGRAFDSMDEAWLAGAPYDEALAWLKGIRGVGDWTAAFVMLRGLGRVERIPPNERRIQEAIARVYGLTRASDEDVQRLAKPYGEIVGLWAHYLRAAG